MNILNEERDMISIISSIHKMKRDLVSLEQTMSEVQFNSQNAESTHGISQTDVRQAMQQEAKDRAKHYMSNDRSHNNAFSHEHRNQNKMNIDVKSENDSISQMLIEIENLRPIKEEAKIINHIVEQEMSNAKVSIEHKYKKPYIATDQLAW